jgi:hypothetical protein
MMDERNVENVKGVLHDVWINDEELKKTQGILRDNLKVDEGYQELKKQKDEAIEAIETYKQDNYSKQLDEIDRFNENQKAHKEYLKDILGLKPVQVTGLTKDYNRKMNPKQVAFIDVLVAPWIELGLND